MRKSISILTILLFILFVCTGSAYAQRTDIQGKSRLLGMIFKLENLEERAATDIQLYESRIKKCEDTIRKCQNIRLISHLVGESLVDFKSKVS